MGSRESCTFLSYALVVLLLFSSAFLFFFFLFLTVRCKAALKNREILVEYSLHPKMFDAIEFFKYLTVRLIQKI
jgi:hypothetical protein